MEKPLISANNPIVLMPEKFLIICRGPFPFIRPELTPFRVQPVKKLCYLNPLSNFQILGRIKKSAKIHINS
jgi:hypothetical protein